MRSRKFVLGGVVVLGLAPVLSVDSAGTGRDSLAAQVRLELSSKWRVEFDPAHTAYVATSPVYALEYKEGCVLYRQSYPEMNGKVSFARMDFYTSYFATAAGDACLRIASGRFFAMEEGTEPYGTLDFIRHAHKGPVSGRDQVKTADLPRLKSCFAPSARDAVDVTYARSRPQPDSVDLAYSVTMKCPGLRAAERIFAASKDGKTIAWDIRASAPIDVHGR
jgi:hypothetical protein